MTLLYVKFITNNHSYYKENYEKLREVKKVASKVERTKNERQKKESKLKKELDFEQKGIFEYIPELEDQDDPVEQALVIEIQNLRGLKMGYIPKLYKVTKNYYQLVT